MTRRISRAWCAAAIAMCSLMAIDGCKTEKQPQSASPSAGSSSSASLDVHAVDAHKLTDAEFKFGVSPTRNAEVTYQPDVVLLEHGAEHVRSMSNNGLQWTLDANAPGADAVQKGKIIFATNRVVGRVLSVVRKGDEMQVILGPVALTDVIEKANLSYDQPVELSSMIAYAAPDYPGADGDTTPEVRTSATPTRATTRVSFASVTESGEVIPMRSQRRMGAELRPAMFTRRDRMHFRAMQAPALPGLPSLPAVPSLPSTPTIGAPTEVSISDFKVHPFCCGGLGMKIEHQDGKGTISAYAVLRLKAPSLRFNLVIDGGTVTVAEVELRGAAGLTVQFDADSKTGLDGNINKSFYVPVDLTIPIGGMAVPFAVTVRQTFLLQTAFSAKNSHLSATGDYGFGGSVRMGYRSGTWDLSAPEQLSTRRNLVESISGASLGINGLVFAYGGRVIVGIGAFGFATGPFIAYNTSVGVTRATDLSAASGRVCGSSSLNVLLKVGIGYQIPKTVTAAINWVLHKLNIEPIAGEGGLGHEEKIVNKEDVFPKDCPIPQ